MLKHSRQGKKHQVGASIRRNAISEACGEDDKASHDGNQGIHTRNAHRFARKLVVASDIATEDGHATNANGKHEERLAHCGIQDFRETGVWIVEEVVEIGQQVEFQTLLAAFKKTRMNTKDSHQNKQGGHHHLGDALYTLLHASCADRKTNQRYQQHPSRHFNRVADHGRKNSGNIMRSVKGSYAGFEQVGNHPTANAGVKHHQDVVANKGKPLEPMPL